MLTFDFVINSETGHTIRHLRIYAEYLGTILKLKKLNKILKKL